jgi:hypothetical protein
MLFEWNDDLAIAGRISVDIQDHLMTGISFEAIDGSMRHMLSFFKGERRGIQ